MDKHAAERFAPPTYLENKLFGTEVERQYPREASVDARMPNVRKVTCVASLISQTSCGCYHMFMDDEKVCRASHTVQSLAVGEDHASIRREKEGPARS